MKYAGHVLGLVESELRGHFPGVTLEISPTTDEILVRDGQEVIARIDGETLHASRGAQVIELFRREVRAAMEQRKAPAK